MKKLGILLSTFLLVCLAANAFACVGKTLIIGTLNTPNETLLAQMMAVIITERTGTTVNVEFFDNQEQLQEAVKKRDVNIYTENTGRALKQLGMKEEGDAQAVYETVKDAYRNQLHLVMLQPFGELQGSGDDKSSFYVPVVAEGILVDYPALPRVINKLAAVTEDKKFIKVLAGVESGDKPKQVARDFLNKNRFI
jgi:osmoprotectant transport system substrate-binding protein